MFRTPARVGLVLSAFAILSACGSTSRPISVVEAEREQARLEEDARAAEARRLLDQLSQANDPATEPAEPEATPQVAAAPARQTAPPDIEAEAPSANLGPSVEIEEVSVLPAPDDAEEAQNDPGAEEPAPPVAVEQPDPAERLALAVEEAAGVLRQRADGPDWPVPPLLKLAALELLEPGVFNSHYLGENGGVTALHPRDVRLLTLWRDLFVRVREHLDSGGFEQDLAVAVDEFATAVRDRQPLEIDRSLLCTRVDGYGLYTELPRYGGTYKLLTGRRHRLIVYVEVDSFARTPDTRDGIDGYRVELVQDLALYHSGDQQDTLAWRKSDQEITDFSRNPRRDFFVVQIIELPETLTVGTYRLKVRMRDAGKTPESEAEAFIDVQLVADASAFAAAR